MTRQDQKARQHGHEILINRNQHATIQSTSSGATQNLTPMERWERENAAHQHWHALAAIKANSGWRECVKDQATSSTKGQGGSVDGKMK